MTKNTRHLEIVIASLLLILGILFSYSIYTDIYWRIDYVNKVLVNPPPLSWNKIFLNWHLPTLICLMLLIGGILLILSKKLGWYLITIVCLKSLIGSIVFTINAGFQLSGFAWITVLTSVVFSLILVFLLSRQVRTKYKIDKISVFIVLLGVAVLIIDQYWI